jgi:hypothetical protein
MTATTTPTANGSKPAASSVRVERKHGMARVLEAQAWRTASVLEDAAFEAERLCHQIYTAVSAAYQSADGSSAAADVAASEDVRSLACEARDCLYAAVGHINDLIAGSEPPPPF